MKGFQLIEILIVLVIISILTSIALPLYQQYFVQEKRLEAIHLLSKLANEMESYYIQNQTYEHATLKKLNFPQIIAHGSYRLQINQTSSNDYVLKAIPINQQAKNDSSCGTLILTSKGENKITGTDKINKCW